MSAAASQAHHAESGGIVVGIRLRLIAGHADRVSCAVIPAVAPVDDFRPD